MEKRTNFVPKIKKYRHINLTNYAISLNNFTIKQTPYVLSRNTYKIKWNTGPFAGAHKINKWMLTIAAIVRAHTAYTYCSQSNNHIYFYFTLLSCVCADVRIHSSNRVEPYQNTCIQKIKQIKHIHFPCIE